MRSGHSNSLAPGGRRRRESRKATIDRLSRPKSHISGVSSRASSYDDDTKEALRNARTALERKEILYQAKQRKRQREYEKKAATIREIEEKKRQEKEDIQDKIEGRSLQHLVERKTREYKILEKKCTERVCKKGTCDCRAQLEEQKSRLPEIAESVNRSIQEAIEKSVRENSARSGSRSNSRRSPGSRKSSKNNLSPDGKISPFKQVISKFANQAMRDKNTYAEIKVEDLEDGQQKDESTPHKEKEAPVPMS